MGKRVMKIRTTPIKGVAIVETTPFIDHRGSFSRLFCDDELRVVLKSRTIKQINHSCTHSVGAVRGLHMQKPPHAEMKLIRCLKGGVWDVAVDLRKDSPTLLQWFALELTPENRCMLVIPEGCAHGFQVLQPDSEMLYLHTAAYTPSTEHGCHPADPAIGIHWPRAITEMSERDSTLPLIDENFTG